MQYGTSDCSFTLYRELHLACRVNTRNVELMAEGLEQYWKWYGQKVNKGIQVSYSLRILEKKVWSNIESLLDLNEMKNNFLYLGNSLIIAINKRKEFGKLKDRIQDILEG